MLRYGCFPFWWAKHNKTTISEIWAIGSAIGDFDGCFTCITGEGDDSGDYEIY